MGAATAAANKGELPRYKTRESVLETVTREAQVVSPLSPRTFTSSSYLAPADFSATAAFFHRRLPRILLGPLQTRVETITIVKVSRSNGCPLAVCTDKLSALFRPRRWISVGQLGYGSHYRHSGYVHAVHHLRPSTAFYSRFGKLTMPVAASFSI